MKVYLTRLEVQQALGEFVKRKLGTELEPSNITVTPTQSNEQHLESANVYYKDEEKADE